MIAYVFGRYSGNYPDFITMVDQYAEMMWLFVSIITYKYILRTRLVPPAITSTTARAITQ